MYRRLGKRVLDIASALGGILVFSPLLILIPILIKLCSTGPIFFTHKRLGVGGRPFGALKFRTMIPNAILIGPQHTLPQDNRITKIGRALRRTSVDELPQLFNVLRGDMSIVGPRPPAYKENLTETDLRRLSVKPGITGLAQVNGRSALTIEQKSAFDLAYIETVSFALDINIILKTIWVAVRGKGVNSRLKAQNS